MITPEVRSHGQNCKRPARASFGLLHVLESQSIPISERGLGVPYKAGAMTCTSTAQCNALRTLGCCGDSSLSCERPRFYTGKKLQVARVEGGWRGGVQADHLIWALVLVEAGLDSSLVCMQSLSCPYSIGCASERVEEYSIHRSSHLKARVCASGQGEEPSLQKGGLRLQEQCHSSVHVPDVAS